MQKWQYRVRSYVKSQQFCDISVSIISSSLRYKQHTTFSLIPQALGSTSTPYKFNHLSKRKRFPFFLLYHCFSFLELIISFYYIDTSVLLENIPLVKFIKTTSRTSGFFHNLTREFIDDVISVYDFPLVGKTIFYSLAALVRKILFCHSKIKFISSRHRVIFSI